ncbi:hypothetical protein DLAC_03283 [Tieghemostelium lacteum]|uniref:Uncharacterized protein n=1 Tax=Tieghemostelium lacteum TaxID=361077 RepID=A0A152A238_TIELA|nr:hypothetical protein DLAC_03283 [Tieghemostelium lacteum]|eukprot:KYR00131.1 hypothetical protein DLAC_03283 [Tieghemostelium lacteum]
MSNYGYLPPILLKNILQCYVDSYLKVIIENIPDDEFSEPISTGTTSFYKFLLARLSLISKDCLKIVKQLNFSRILVKSDVNLQNLFYLLQSGYKFSSIDIKELDSVFSKTPLELSPLIIKLLNETNRNIVGDEGVGQLQFDKNIAFNILENYETECVIIQHSNNNLKIQEKLKLYLNSINSINNSISQLKVYASKDCVGFLDFVPILNEFQVKSLSLYLNGEKNMKIFRKERIGYDQLPLNTQSTLTTLVIKSDNYIFSKIPMYIKDYINILKYNPLLETLILNASMVYENLENSIQTLIIDELVNHQSLKIAEIYTHYHPGETHHDIIRLLNNNQCLQKLSIKGKYKDTRPPNIDNISNCTMKEFSVFTESPRGGGSNTQWQYYDQWITPSALTILNLIGTFHPLAPADVISISNSILQYHQNATQVLFDSTSMEVMDKLILGLPYLDTVCQHSQSPINLNLLDAISKSNLKRMSIHSVENSTEFLIGLFNMNHHSLKTIVFDINQTPKLNSLVTESLCNNRTIENLLFKVDNETDSDFQFYFDFLINKVNLKSLICVYDFIYKNIYPLNKEFLVNQFKSYFKRNRGKDTMLYPDTLVFLTFDLWDIFNQSQLE